MNHTTNATSIKIPRTRRWLAIATLWIIIATLVSACGGTASQGAPPCGGGDGKYTCQGRSGHQITLSDVPADVRPDLLPITDDQDQKLRDAPKDGTGCIFVIVGDLAFYDKDNKLIQNPKFDSPVTITYTFTADDMKAFEVCKAALIKSGTVSPDTKVDFVPVYYFNDVWKPFDPNNYKIDADGNVTISFTSWGDSPFGGGSKP